MVKPNTSPGILSGFGQLLVLVCVSSFLTAPKICPSEKCMNRSAAILLLEQGCMFYLSTPGNAASDPWNIRDATAHLAEKLKMKFHHVQSKTIYKSVEKREKKAPFIRNMKYPSSNFNKIKTEVLKEHTVSFISPEYWNWLYFNAQTLNIWKAHVSQPVLPDRTLFLLDCISKCAYAYILYMNLNIYDADSWMKKTNKLVHDLQYLHIVRHASRL